MTCESITSYSRTRDTNMGFARLFLPLISLFFRVICHFGILLDLRIHLMELCYGKERFTVRRSKNPLFFLSASAIVEHIRDGKITAESIIQAYIERIREVNPLLNAVVNDRFEEALEEAKHIDEVLSKPSKHREKIELLSKPLLGVPITVKESISCQGLPNSSGLVDRSNLVAEVDSEAVANLRKAGAIPIAVTNCSELCMWWETTNNVYGRTNNPYNTTKIAGGSSGGEGAIIASAGSICGVGSDAGGSIRMPAFFNGIAGHKPSPGIVPNRGHFPHGTSETFNEYLTIGPMCRYVEDLPLMLKAMAGPNIHRLRLHQPIDISSIKIITVEVFDPVMMSKVDNELLFAETKVLDYLEDRFGVKTQKADLRLFRYSALIWSAMVMNSEDKTLISKFLQGDSKSMNPFVELAKYLGGFSKFHFITPVVGCLEKMNCFDGMSSTFVALGNKLRQQLESLLGNDGVLLFPSHPYTAVCHNKPLLSPLDFNYTAVFNVLRMPVTQCPLGLDKQGLPLGIQIAASRDNDRLTLAVAKALEEGFVGWDAWQPGI